MDDGNLYRDRTDPCHLDDAYRHGTHDDADIDARLDVLEGHSILGAIDRRRFHVVPVARHQQCATRRGCGRDWCGLGQ